MLLLVYCICMKHRARFVRLLACPLRLLAIDPLRAPVNGIIAGVHHEIRPADPGVVWSNEDIMETGRVDGSMEDDFDDYDDNDDDDYDREPATRGGSCRHEPKPKRQERAKQRPEPRSSKPEPSRRRRGRHAEAVLDEMDNDVDDDDEFGEAKSNRVVEEVADEVDEDEVDEVDGGSGEEEGAEALGAAEAIQARLNALEAKISLGGR